MIKINLLPVRAAAKKESLRKQLTIAVLSLVACLIVTAYFHYAITSQIEEKNVRIAETQREIDRLKSVIAKVNKFKKDSKVLEQKLNVIKELNEGRLSSVYLMDGLSKVMPEKLWLSNLREADWKLTIQGQSMNQSTIADFMTNMERSPLFTSVKWKVTQSKKESGSGLDLHAFTIEATFIPPTK